MKKIKYIGYEPDMPLQTGREPEGESAGVAAVGPGGGGERAVGPDVPVGVPGADGGTAERAHQDVGFRLGRDLKMLGLLLLLLRRSGKSL